MKYFLILIYFLNRIDFVTTDTSLYSSSSKSNASIRDCLLNQELSQYITVEIMVVIFELQMQLLLIIVIELSSIDLLKLKAIKDIVITPSASKTNLGIC